MSGEQRPTGLRNWPGVVLILLIGYMCMGRSFAYWGIPAWHIFVGEIVLFWFLAFGPRAATGTWLWIALHEPAFKKLSRLVLLLLAYGAFEILHGIYKGYPPLTAIRGFAFDYYTLYLFLGLWVGLHKPGELPELFHAFAWINGLYGVVYILFLSRLSWIIPGVSEQSGQVPVFGLPEFSSIALLGLLVLEKDLRPVWHLLLLNGLVLLGMQVRAEWVAFAVGAGIFTLATKRFRKVAFGAAAVMLVLIFAYAANVELPGPLQRGGPASAGDIIGRALAAIDPYWAADYTASYQTDADSAVWRTVWWASIWQEVNGTAGKALFGLGYGYPLGDLSPPVTQGDFNPSPHNGVVYALGYTGWIGLLLFALFQGTLLRLLWKAYRTAGQVFGIVFWAAMLAMSSFTSVLEAPYGAIPFYLLSGWFLAPLLPNKRAERSALFIAGALGTGPRLSQEAASARV